MLVKDILPGAIGSFPLYLVNGNGTLFFGVGNGGGLWKSDGTAAATVLVKAGYVDALSNVNGTLFFAGAANNCGNCGNASELWKSDGTAEGTMLVKAGYAASNPAQLVDVNGTLFFAADDGVKGNELWKSDGTAAGTVLVEDINPGAGHSDPLPLLNVNGTLFFTADDGVHGVQLWKYVSEPNVIERPVLNIARVGNQVALSWPANDSGYTLEANTDLSSSLNWSNGPGTPTMVGNQYTFTNSVASGNQFYRLRKP